MNNTNKSSTTLGINELSEKIRQSYLNVRSKPILQKTNTRDRFFCQQLNKKNTKTSVFVGDSDKSRQTRTLSLEIRHL